MTQPGFNWEPGRYLEYRAERLRPAIDLLARVPLEVPERIADLGCGPGNATALLAARWPRAALVGVDSSAKMLERARQTGPSADWVQADLADWRPDGDFDLLYSNATLQWLPDHGPVLTRWFAALAPGGCLAVQMPRNFDAPSHRLIAETLANGPWADRLAGLRRTRPVAEPEVYADLFADLGAPLDLWETTYLHILDGDDPVFRWVSGTALRPILGQLMPDEVAPFQAALAARLAAAYPKRKDGRTLFPFRRLFLVARKPGAPTDSVL